MRLLKRQLSQHCGGMSGPDDGPCGRCSGPSVPEAPRCVLTSALEYTRVQNAAVGTKNRRDHGSRSHGCHTARRPVPSRIGACVCCLFPCKDLVLSCPVLKTKTPNCLRVLASTGRTDPSQAADGRCVVISRSPAVLGALRWAMKHPHEAPTRRRILRSCP